MIESPANGNVVAMLLAAALGVSGAMFLILESNTRFCGVTQITIAPMDTALGHLGR